MTESPLHRWFAEGLRRQQAAEYPGAVLAWKQVLAVDPEQADAWCNLGGCLRELKRLEEAEAALLRCLEVQPSNLAARCNLGILAMDRGASAEALEIFDAVLAEDPGCGPARFHRGNVLANLDRWAEGLAAAQAVAEACPDLSAAQVNAGWHLMKAGRLPEAEAAFDRALGLDPDLPAARWNRAYVRLLQGHWREAWADFPARLAIAQGLPNLKRFEEPVWDGGGFQGRTLLLWCEQGFGDTVQFLRFLPEVAALGGRVVVQVQPALLPLLQDQGLPGTIVAEGQPLPPFDLQAPLLDLPRLLAVGPDTLRDAVPYVQPPPAPPALARALDQQGLRIGLAWTGNPAHQDQARRSLSPRAFAPLAHLPGVAWFSLQRLAPRVDPEALPPELKAVDLAPHFATFRETAAAVAAMDLVITVDTVIVHLAGALGVPAFLLLPAMPDWRWGQTGDTTPWYPTVRLYRQTGPGAWEPVIQRLLADLRGV